MHILKSFKSISIITYFVALGGLALQLAALTDIQEGTLPVYLLTALNYLFPGINLSYLDSHIFSYTNYNNYLVLNYLELTFFAFILIGAIAYTYSKAKETRIIRFAFSIFLFSKLLGIISFIISPIVYAQYFRYDLMSMLWWGLGLTNCAAWAYISYILVKHLNSEKSLDYFPGKPSITGDKLYVDTPKMQRVTHWILDILFSLLIGSVFVINLGRPIFAFLEQFLGDRFTLYIVFSITQILYYPFFEILFGATPAKLLTESRVVNADGSRIDFAKGLVRTITRKIPFEPFSYLGMGNGWHDSLSGTIVVKEKQTGIAAKYYLLIIPFFILIGVLSYFGHEELEDYRYRQSEKASFQEKVDRFDRYLSHLKDNYIIEIKDLEESYGPSVYLKVDDIGNEKVVCSYFQMKDYYPSGYDIEREFLRNQYTYPIVEVKVKDLIDAITKDYEKYNHNERNGAPLLGNGKKYEIVEIYRLYTPLIESSGSSIRDEYINFSLRNKGGSGQLTAITNIEGELEWQMELPLQIESAGTYGGSSISLNAIKYKQGRTYKFSFAVRDSIGGIQNYIVEGINCNYTIKEEFQAGN